MNLTIQNTADGVRVGVTGDLTGPGATAFAEQFKEKVPEGSAAAVDFSGVGSVDIEGLRKLITVDRWLKGRGGKLILSGVNGEVMNLLKANGVQSMFQIEEGGPAMAPSAPAPVPPAEPPTAPQPPPAAVRNEAPPERRSAAPPPERSAPPPVVAEDASAWTRPPVRETPQAATPPTASRQSPPPRSQDETAAWSRPAAQQAPSARPVPPMPEPPAAAAGAWEAPPPPPARSASPPSLPPTAPASSGGWDATPAPPPLRTPPAIPSPAPAAAPAPDDVWRAPSGPKGPPAMPVSGVPELPDRGTIWGRPGTTGTSSSAGKSKSKTKGKGGGKGLIIGLAALALVGGGGFAAWKFLGVGQPKTATFSVAPPKEVTLEVGTRADFTISATNADEIRMDGAAPAGLTFKSSASGETATGSFSGVVEEGAAPESTLRFTAMLKGKGEDTRSVKFAAATPVKIEAEALVGDVGKPLPIVGSRLASGAVECSLEPAPTWGKVVSESDGGKNNWILTGTPTEAGEFKAKVTAKAANGETKTGDVTITVRAAAPVVADTPPPTTPPVPVTPPPVTGGETGPPPANPNPQDTPPQTPPVKTDPPPVVVADTPPVAKAKEIPPQLRSMIQARMDKMSTTRLPDNLRRQINSGLNFVEAVEVIGGVTFATGSTELNAAAKKRIADALASPDLRAMLEAGKSQILVVGYASPQGSAAANLKLSRQRAESVARHLDDMGHHPRFHDGYGETKLVGANSAAANQSVEIYIVQPSSTYTDPLEQLVEQLNSLRQRMTAEEAP